MEQRQRYWSSKHFSKCAKSYWVPHDALKDTDKDMKWVMVSFSDDLIPYKEVVKVGSTGEQKKVFVSYILLSFYKYIDLYNFHFLLFPYF